MSKTIWIPKGLSKKRIKTFRLVDTELQRLVNKEKETGILNPDLVRGIECEEYIMYIFETGYRDAYHVIVESAYEEFEHKVMTSDQIYKEYKIYPGMINE